MKQSLTALAVVAALAAGTAAAMPGDGGGEATFDLSSQRGEIQHFNPVPGQRVDHAGIIINPTPQTLVMDQGGGSLAVADGWKVKDRSKAFDAKDLAFLGQRGGKGARTLDIAFGDKAADRAGVSPLDGAYALTVGPGGVTIVGRNERGAFYGLQTLRDLLESPAVKDTGAIPYMSIQDFPAIPSRGVVEGFYGTPWSHQVRLSLLDFYGRNKLNKYFYGPKDDPFHSSPNWRKPYPADQAANIHDLVEAARRNRVDFVWAIHPGKDIRWTPEDYDSLVAKLDMMYDLGVRQFAIFFDDIEGQGTRPSKQVELINSLVSDFIKSKGDVGPLVMCPTDYSRLWANPTENGALAYYGNHMDPSVEVFYTGDVVCSDLTRDTMDFLNTRIKRPGHYWWNFPVSDYCRNYILQGPVYGLDGTLTAQEVCGLESNPMEHGEASKLALYGVADYGWNPAAYNALDNWERGLELLAPEAADAYRTFAIHSADTETGYRRDESWETATFPYNRYTQAQFDSLRAEFQRVQAVPERMEAISNRALLEELRPWLVEFGKIGQRGLSTLDLIKTYEAGDTAAFWEAYAANLMTPEQQKAYEAHKSGTMVLHPFYENSMEDMVRAFYHSLTGEVPMAPSGVGSYPNLKTTQARLMLDNDSTTFYTSGTGQGTGQWIGLDLGDVRPVDQVSVWQGRNSVDDVDYYDNVILEASLDGREWRALTDSLLKTYVIDWQVPAGEQAVPARYVRIRKLPSDKRNWASVRMFRVNPPSQARVGLDVRDASATEDQFLLAFDHNPMTGYVTAEALEFDRPADAGEVILLMGDDVQDPARVLEQLDAKGAVLSTVPAAGSFARVRLQDGTKRLRLKGHSRLFEVVPQK